MDWIGKNVKAIDFSKWQIVLESEEWETTEINMNGDIILNEYYDFFSGENNLPSNSVYDCKLEVKDTIRQLKNQPIRKSSVNEQKELHKQVEEGLKTGTIIHSTAEITSPVLFVKKSNGTLGMCIDYRQLNKHIEKDINALPRIDQLMDNLAGMNWYTCIDLRGALI
jgi:hypothetical protein